MSIKSPHKKISRPYSSEKFELFWNFSFHIEYIFCYQVTQIYCLQNHRVENKCSRPYSSEKFELSWNIVFHIEYIFCYQMAWTKSDVTFAQVSVNVNAACSVVHEYINMSVRLHTKCLKPSFCIFIKTSLEYLLLFAYFSFLWHNISVYQHTI